MENKNVKKKVKNEKTKNIIWKVVHGISYVLSGCFIGVCCFACANQSKNNKPKNNDVVYVEEKQDLISYPKYIQYNENDNHVILEVSDLSNNFVNLYNSFIENYDVWTETNLQYDDKTYSPQFTSSQVNWFFESYDYIVLSSEGVFTYIVDSEATDWEYSLTIECGNENYNDIVEAVESDIGSGDINSGIFETLTDSLVGYVDVLNQGLQDMVSIVYNSTTNKLTAIGYLITIVVAVSLGYFLFRLISSYIRLRG